MKQLTTNGKILEGVGGRYTVEITAKEAEYHHTRIPCQAKGAFRHENITPLPGDNVEILMSVPESGEEASISSVITDINDYNVMGNAFREIYNSTGTGDGIYWQQEVLSSTECFMKGNFLFAQSVLGELESEELRNVSFDKGLVPFPKYDSRKQDEYHTMVHDQTELGAILVTTSSFARASAFMQYANEQSADVVTEYYEFSLKFKYNEDAAIRSMIDLVYETIDVPFGMQFEKIILDYGTSLTPLYEGVFYNSLSNKFDSNKQAYKVALDKALEEFNKLP